MSNHILLIEDNAADVFLVRHALSEHGIEHCLTVMADGEQALRFFECPEHCEGPSRVELILLDLNLPRHDGFTVLKRLRQIPVCNEKAVIVLTSSDAQMDRERATQLGAVFFRKPIELDGFLELGALVKGLLQAQSEGAGCGIGAASLGAN
jgi:hypothetical protein